MKTLTVVLAALVASTIGCFDDFVTNPQVAVSHESENLRNGARSNWAGFDNLPPGAPIVTVISVGPNSIKFNVAPTSPYNAEVFEIHEGSYSNTNPEGILKAAEGPSTLPFTVIVDGLTCGGGGNYTPVWTVRAGRKIGGKMVYSSSIPVEIGTDPCPE